MALAGVDRGHGTGGTTCRSADTAATGQGGGVGAGTADLDPGQGGGGQYAHPGRRPGTGGDHHGRRARTASASPGSGPTREGRGRRTTTSAAALRARCQHRARSGGGRARSTRTRESSAKTRERVVQAGQVVGPRTRPCAAGDLGASPPAGRAAGSLVEGARVVAVAAAGAGRVVDPGREHGAQETGPYGRRSWGTLDRRARQAEGDSRKRVTRDPGQVAGPDAERAVVHAGRQPVGDGRRRAPRRWC